jgi:4-hydroxybutyrate dehydrogenase
MSETVTTFCFPTLIHFGPGALKKLREELQERGITRPLVVTDHILRKTPVFDTVYGQLDGAPIFDAVEPNPTEQNVMDGVNAYRRERCDGIVGVGGGSPLDAAKAIRLKATHEAPLADYDDLQDGWKRIGKNVPPFVAVPTTSGTGSDVSRSTVITITATNRKTVIFSPHLMPSVSVSDPELTLDMPPKVTAGTGMDAFTHNLEAYLSVGYHPMCDAIALQGVRLAWHNLPAVMSTPHELKARTGMMMSAIMGAVAFQKGLGATHSLAHPLSTIAKMHHGTANAVMLPFVMEFNLPAVRERMHDLAVAMDGTAPEMAIDSVRELNRVCGIAPHLRDYGVKEDMLPAMAAKAMEDGCRLLNPRPVSEQEMLELYRKAL